MTMTFISTRKIFIFRVETTYIYLFSFFRFWNSRKRFHSRFLASRWSGSFAYVHTYARFISVLRKYGNARSENGFDARCKVVSSRNRYTRRTIFARVFYTGVLWSMVYRERWRDALSLLRRWRVILPLPSVVFLPNHRHRTSLIFSLPIVSLQAELPAPTVYLLLSNLSNAENGKEECTRGIITTS